MSYCLWIFSLFVFNICLGAPLSKSETLLIKNETSLPSKYFTRFQTYTQRSPQQDGPNCFQSTAYITGLTQRSSYMSDQEFMALLKKFNCEKIEKYDSIKSGDIGLLSSNFSFDGKAKGYEHAFIWDRYPDYLIEKIGSYSSFKLKQTHIKESESWTLFKKECLTEPEKCPLKLTNYRCPYYLAEKPWHGSPSLEEHRKLIDSWIHSNENPLTPDITKTLDELKTIIEEIKKEEKKSTLSLGKIIEKEEAISLLRQVQIFQDPN